MEFRAGIISTVFTLVAPHLLRFVWSPDKTYDFQSMGRFALITPLSPGPRRHEMERAPEVSSGARNVCHAKDRFSYVHNFSHYHHITPGAKRSANFLPIVCQISAA